MGVNPGFLGAVLTLISMGVIGLVWLVRLEGRVNGHDREIKDTKDQQGKDVREIHADLRYIRERLDRVLETQGR